MPPKRLAVYYHMPCHVASDGSVYTNPVIGSFVESLAVHFDAVILLCPEIPNVGEATTYRLENKRVEVIGLGPAGRYWDHFKKMRRIKRTVEAHRHKWDALLFRVPTARVDAIWRYAGRPSRTAFLVVGNTVPLEHANFRSLSGLLLLGRAFWLDAKLARLCRRASHLVVANSPALVRYWERRSGSRVALVNTSSLSANDFVANPDRALFRREPSRLLYVGRVCLDKGIRELLAALGILEQRCPGRFTLDIVGPAGDLGGTTISEMIRASRVDKVVTYRGSVPFGPALLQYYGSADAYLLPSYHEGMPKTVWEAMSQATPVIATAVGGMKDFFEDGREIMLIPPRSVEAIVSAVLRLAADPALALDLSRRGYSRAKSVTRESQASRISDLMVAKWTE